MKDVAWAESVIKPVFATLQSLGEEHFDLIVVGGGLSGVSCALHASKGGLKVALLEGSGVGSGASGRNAGFVVPHYPGVSPAQVEVVLGRRKGEALNTLVAGGGAFVFEQIKALDIECEAVQNGWLQAAHSEKSSRTVQHMIADWRAVGASVDYLDADALEERLGKTSYRDGWLLSSGGYVNPYALTMGLAEAAVRAGVAVIEQAPVSGVFRDTDGYLVNVDARQLKTKKVLLAMNAYASDDWGGVARHSVPIRLYTTLSQPLGSNSREQVLPGRPCVSDLHAAPRFSRMDQHGRLVGAGMCAITGGRSAKGRQVSERALAETFLDLGPLAVDRYWEGYCTFTRTALPVLQVVDEGVYAVSGFSGRGVCLAQVLGPVLADLVSERCSVDDVPLSAEKPRSDPLRSFKRVMAPLAYQMLKKKDALKLS